MWCVYILKSLSKNWYYVGSTNRLETRVHEHNQGYVRSTKAYIPLKTVYSRKFESEMEARSYEKKLKQKRIEKEKILRSLENIGEW